MLIGAHPDDAEVVAGGTIAKWCKAGFDVTIVSMTNGNKGHHKQTGVALAKRRKAESKKSANIAGARSVVFDVPDGELEPTLPLRKKVVSLIRNSKADLVITHRPNDYHPDHRYTSQVVQDAAYMVTVPHFVPSAPALRENPTFMYFMDRFQKPCPFTPDVAVAVDDAMETKWRMLDAMESQVYEWLAWHAGVLDTVPKRKAERMAWLQQVWGPRLAGIAKQHRKALPNWYTLTQAKKIQFAEFFELSEYGRQSDRAEMVKLFPFLSSSRKSKKK